MYFLFKDDYLLEKYITFQNKVRADIKKEFDSIPVYDEKFLKTKIKSPNESDEDQIFFNKYLSWSVFQLINTFITFKTYVQSQWRFIFSLFMINQTPDEVSHLSFKQKEHGISLQKIINYLYNLKSQNIDR